MHGSLMCMSNYTCQDVKKLAVGAEYFADNRVVEYP